MHRPALRSALQHTARSVVSSRPAAAAASSASAPVVPSRPPAAAAAAALFSTTSSHSVLKWVPSSKERQAAAASELSSLDSSNANAGSSTAAAAYPAKPSSVSPFSKEPPAGMGGASAAGSSNRIINVRSLPRTSGGPRFPGTGVSDAAPAGGRFRASVQGGSQAGGFGGFGGFGNRPSAGGRTSGGLKARRARPRGKRARAPGPGNERKLPKRAEGLTEEQEQELYIEAREWLHFHEFGTPVAYEPSLSREGLLGFSPAVASSAAAPAGHLSTALRSMRLVAGGNPFSGSFEPGESHTAASPHPEAARNQVHKNAAVFFDTMVERVQTEQALHSKRAIAKLKAANLPAETPLVKAPSAVTKAAILEAAVRGLYEGPSSATTSAGPLLDTTHRYQAKDNTYSSAKAQQFEAKILELLPKEAAAGKASAKAKQA